MQKSCNKCGKSKSIDDFHNDKRRKDGKYPNCKECHYEYTRQRSRRKDVVEKRRAYYQKKKEEDSFKKASRKRNREFYASIRGRAKTLLSSAKRCSSDEVPCTLTAEYIEGLLRIGKCAVTGIDFDLDKPKDNKKKNAFAPSIDRIDPNKGYTEENIRIVIWQYNLMKGELSDVELYAICKKVVTRYDHALCL